MLQEVPCASTRVHMTILDFSFDALSYSCASEIEKVGSGKRSDFKKYSVQ